MHDDGQAVGDVASLATDGRRGVHDDGQAALRLWQRAGGGRRGDYDDGQGDRRYRVLKPLVAIRGMKS